MLEKGTLQFHDFVRISKTYPLQSLKKKEVFKDGSGYKIRGIPVAIYKKIRVYSLALKSNKFEIFNLLLLFHNYSRQETNILSPEGLSMSNSVVY